MHFYFVRHGETDANKAGLLAGSGLDHELNDTGLGQARTLASTIARRLQRQPHRLLVSEMKRTRQTAAPLAEALGLPAEIIPDFREWNLGEWEGQTFEAFGHLILGDGEPAKGESRKGFYSRVEEAWRTNHHDEQAYVIVSHGAVWLAMQDILKIPRFKISNCELVKVEYGSAWTAEILK